MGWSIGFDDTWKRDIGYSVPAFCDHPGCMKVIDRGLSYVCGGEPYGGNHGCGLFFCPDHQHIAGDKRDNARLCSRCYSGKGKYFTPTPDHPDWIKWKLTDPSWEKWRQENPEEVTKMQGGLDANTTPDGPQGSPEDPA